MSRVVHLLGPTASGKSALAERAAAAFDAEIISVDSALVYRGMDIGTAKPPPLILDRIRHWLIDLCEPEETYSAARFAADASAAERDILARGKRVILVGGTMLYFRALCDGLSALPESDPDLRARLQGELLERGAAQLHDELQRLDPQAGARIHATDTQRLLRALEVIRLTGQPLSALQTRDVQQLPPITALRLAYAPAERARLHERIASRLVDMFANGLIDEVARLRSRPGLTAEHPSMRAVGYRQVWAHLDGQIDAETMRAKALFATRQLAKRQTTWLRSERQLHWLDALAPGAEDAAMHQIEKHFTGKSNVHPAPLC